MKEAISQSPIQSIAQPRYLWFLTLSYVMVLVLANWFEARFIHILGMDTTAGTILFPFTFIFADMITEVYGYKHARRAILVGFFFNIFYITYGHIVINLPSPDFATDNAKFDAIMNANVRIVIASMVSYLSAEPLNAYIVAKLKIHLRGKYMALRFISSTIVAAGFDSVLFMFIAFYGVIAFNDLLTIMLSVFFLKVMVEVLGLPVSTYVTRKLKTIEQLDTYDTDTKFRLLSFDGDYSNQNNHYKK